MRKDTTKKFLMRENRFKGLMISKEIRNFLKVTKQVSVESFDIAFGRLTYDTIRFINILASKCTSKDTSNNPCFITKEKIRVVVNKKSKQVSFNMVCCEEGSFTMGHIEKDDNPPRLETIERAFWLGETEVTQELYKLVMGKNPSKFHFRYASEYLDAQKHPVENVTRYNAMDFCNALSRLQGLQVCYTEKLNAKCEWYWECDFNKNGYRLPTSKEWEYAAKAGTQNRWAGTDDEKKLGEYAWFRDNSKYPYTNLEGETQPVARKKPNEWGFYDMSGNVWEWCEDADGSVPGGSSQDVSFHLNLSGRSYVSFDFHDETIGFRICRTM